MYSIILFLCLAPNPDEQIEVIQATVQVESEDKLQGLKVISSEKITEDKYPVPNPKITGADQAIPIGEIITLELEDNPPSNVTAVYTWKLIYPSGQSKICKVWPDGKSLFAGSGSKPGFVIAILNAVYLYKVENEFVLRASDPITKLVTIGNVPPDPNPGPGPDPNPGPPPVVVPDGYLGATKFAYTVAKDTNLDKKAAKVVADALKSGASAIAAGAAQEFSQGLVLIRDTNKQKLKEAGISEDVIKVSSTKIADKLFELYQAKQVTTLTQLKDWYSSVAEGLEIWSK